MCTNYNPYKLPAKIKLDELSSVADYGFSSIFPDFTSWLEYHWQKYPQNIDEAIGVLEAMINSDRLDHIDAHIQFKYDISIKQELLDFLGETNATNQHAI